MSWDTMMLNTAERVMREIGADGRAEVLRRLGIVPALPPDLDAVRARCSEALANGVVYAERCEAIVREDVPALLVEVKRLRRAIESARDRIVDNGRQAGNSGTVADVALSLGAALREDP